MKFRELSLSSKKIRERRLGGGQLPARVESERARARGRNQKKKAHASSKKNGFKTRALLCPFLAFIRILFDIV